MERLLRVLEMQRVDPSLADLGLIGDGATAALVDHGGSIRWMCVPNFDSEPHGRGEAAGRTRSRLGFSRRR